MFGEPVLVDAVYVDHGTVGTGLVGQADNSHPSRPQRRSHPTALQLRQHSGGHQQVKPVADDAVEPLRPGSVVDDALDIQLATPRSGVSREEAVGEAGQSDLGWHLAGSALRDQPSVPLGCDQWVAHRLLSAELNPAFDNSTHVRVTLLLVGVQQIRVSTAQRQIELESHVLGVPDSRAHALAEEGRHLMGGIAGEQDASDPPGVGDQRPEGVGAHSDQFGVVWAQVAGGSVPDPLGLALLLELQLGVEHEADPLVFVPAGDNRRRLLRVADLHHREIDRGVELEVADHPRFTETVVVLVDAEVLAHEAVAAVARHDIAGGNCVADLGSGYGERHVRAVLLQSGDPDRMPNIDLGQVAARFVEGVLEVRLIEAVHLRPAATAELGKVELHQPLADVVLEPIPLWCFEFGQDSLSDTKGGEGTHRLIVEDAGPRKAVQPGVSLQRHDAVSALPQ